MVDLPAPLPLESARQLSRDLHFPHLHLQREIQQTTILCLLSFVATPLLQRCGRGLMGLSGASSSFTEIL